tara:strand:- start:29605 stop:30441 length:837 start_codon:yes stop_codon:yes gene_type:complete
VETKILGLSGKKQSGKNTSANFILGQFMKNVNLISDFQITGEGQLWIVDLLGDESVRGVFDVFRKNSDMDKFKETELNHFIQLYSMADLLKENICINVLNLTRKQCYGTDEQKDTKTHLLWENMPGVMTKEKFTELGLVTPLDGIVCHEPGPMTGREVMQYVGTEMFRKMYGNVWVDSTIRKIKQDNPTMAIVCDIRFPNEVEGVQQVGGKVLRLLRDPYQGEDQHASETALDDYPPEKFDWVVDNREQSIEEQNNAIFQLLQEINWIPKPFVEYITI